MDNFSRESFLKLVNKLDNMNDENRQEINKKILNFNLADYKSLLKDKLNESKNNPSSVSNTPSTILKDKLYQSDSKKTPWLFATECQFDRKSQDMYNIDLENFFSMMTDEDPELSYFISHRNKNYDASCTDANNSNLAMFKYSRYEGINQFLTALDKQNGMTNIRNADDRYANIYIRFNEDSYEDYPEHIRDTLLKIVFYQSNYIQTNLERCFVNVEKYPLARMYMHGKVIGKIYHKIYELTNYRKRTFAFEECLTILRTMGKYRQEGDANFDQFMKSKDFWYWYSKEAMYHDEHRFKYN